MRERVIIIIVAVFCGIVAAFMVNSYANQAKEAALVKVRPVKVWVAVRELPVGLTMADLVSRKLIELKDIPRDFVAENAVLEKNDLKKQVIAQPVSRAEQLTANRFRQGKEAGLSFSMPEDMVSVAIPINNMKAAGNLIKIGDWVNVVGTLKTPPDDKAITKTVLQKVKVLAINQNLENQEKSESPTRGGVGGQSSSSTEGNQTVTVALTQADAEKLIFIQEEGRVWLTLLPSKNAKTVSTQGQTIDSVLK